MSTFTFEPATKAGARARLALSGPTGSGKTYTALAIASAWGGKIALVDTERGSASKYAKNPETGKGLFAFDRLNLTRYDPRDLPPILAAAADRGYATVIIDSLSRFWSGSGGMLEQVDAISARSYHGNSFAAWKDARPWEAAMVEAMLGFPGHVIVTMRVKTEWVITENERGKKMPQKIGLQPEQRQGIEYEFDIVGDMTPDNDLLVSKTRCPDLAGRVFSRPGAEFARIIADWLEDGVPVASAADYRAQALSKQATHASLRELYAAVQKAGLLGAAVTDDTGDALSLGQLIISKGKEAEARETIGGQVSATVSEEPETAAQPVLHGPDPAAAGADPADDPAATSHEDPWAGPPPDAEPQAPTAQPGPLASEAEWVSEFMARLADAVPDDLGDLQRQIGEAIRDKKIDPQTASELATEIRKRRSNLAGAAA